MDSDSWARVSSYSRRRLSRSDVYHGEGYQVEEDPNPEYLCPFCAEDFDMVGLCCHIDEMHTIPAKNGVCPVCTRNVGYPLPHYSTFTNCTLRVDYFCLSTNLEWIIFWRRLLRRGGSNSPSSFLRRELRDGSLQSLFGGSSLSGSTSNIEPDPMLTSFILSPPMVDKSYCVKPLCSVETGSIDELSLQNPENRSEKLSEEDMKEKAQRCNFAQGLLLSTFLDDNL
ncbi:hypothetical protein OROGR_014466 [Orobanche gracilis]